jgi:hypothetical protein
MDSRDESALKQSEDNGETETNELMGFARSERIETPAAFRRAKWRY